MSMHGLSLSSYRTLSQGGPTLGSWESMAPAWPPAVLSWKEVVVMGWCHYQLLQYPEPWVQQGFLVFLLCCSGFQRSRRSTAGRLKSCQLHLSWWAQRCPAVIFCFPACTPCLSWQGLGRRGAGRIEVSSLKVAFPLIEILQFTNIQNTQMLLGKCNSLFLLSFAMLLASMTIANGKLCTWWY